MDENEVIQNCASKSANKDSKPKIRYVTIDFGISTVYGEYTKKMPVEKLHNTEKLCYKIMRGSDASPIYNVFSFNKYEGIVKPGEILILKIIYKPIIPHERDIDNFEFIDSSFNIIKIKVIGESAGPILKASVKQLYFFITPSEKIRKKILELRNISNVPAEFSFDSNGMSDVFNVEPTRGIIKQQRHFYIQISFQPKESGFYSKQLFCLTWGGSPLLIPLHGVYREASEYYNLKSTRCQSYSFPLKDAYGYRAYMQDCPNSKIADLPVSISRNYIDFGRMLKSDKMNPSTEFVTLTNNLESAVHVKWPNDDIFNIIPKKASITSKATVSFKCSFCPSSNNKLYSTTLTAQIKWMAKTIYGFVVPIPASIKLQGHSFPEDEYWMANIDVSPRNVTLPACLPGDVSFTNFKITSLSHLPVMYKLIPPKKTNFIMKPMVGIINKSEIVAVQLSYDGTDDTKLFKEVWHIELNGRGEKQIELCVRAEVSLPKIILGDNYVIKFEYNQPGCQSIIKIPLKNISQYQIRYDIINEKYDCLKISPSEGIVPSKEEISLKCSYTGNLDYPKEIKINYTLQRMQNMQEVTGQSYKRNITVITNCRYQQLVATPTFYNFGEIQLDTFLDTEFYVFNFGKLAINYLLHISYADDNLDNLKIDPAAGDVKPQSKRKIRITGFAKTLGGRTINISYVNRKHQSLKEIVDNEYINLFEMCYMTVLPIIQIGSVVEHNFGQLFSKKHFWEYLKIEELNELLKNMTKGESRSIVLQLPEVQVSDQPYYVILELENKSKYELDLSLERKQLCNCTVKEVAVKINKTKKMFDCDHREMLSIELSEPKFYENTQQLLTIRIRYLLPGITPMSYKLQLPHDRNIELLFSVISIPPDTFKISSYKTEFCMNLRNISVCRKIAPIQVFWFYNNTNLPATYNVDTKELLYLCQNEGFEILKCLNPKGTIEPHGTLPLMIKFQPTEVKEYIVSAPLKCGEEIYNFYIKGTGQLGINIQVFKSRMPTMSRKCPIFPIILSQDYIPINYIPIWSTMERIIFIRNTSKDKTFQYFWEDFFFRVGISNIVELTAKNKSGILHPQESKATVIKINTFNEACMTSLQLPCYFLDHNQLIAHQKCVEELTKRNLQKDKWEVDDVETYEEEAIIPHPTTYIKTVIISFHIIHTNDRDNFFTTDEQFKCTVQDQITIDTSNLMNSDQKVDPNKEEEKIEDKPMQYQERVEIEVILERLIADFVFSNSLVEVLDYSEKLSSPIYEQFILDERKIIEKKKTNEPLSNKDLSYFRVKQIKLLFTRPKPTVVSKIVEDLIIDGMHDNFHLGVFTSTVSDQEKDKSKAVLMRCLENCKCERKIKKFT